MACSPYDTSQDSTVWSRKQNKSKLAEGLSPVRHPQAIIGEGIISNSRKHEHMIGEGLAPATDSISDGEDLARGDFLDPVKSLTFNDEDADYQMASSLPIPTPVTGVIAYGMDGQQLNECGHALSETGNETGASEQQQTQEFADFHEQFLNNHISTIDEDFEGENMTSEFSTQRTQTKNKREIDPSLKSNTGEKESETPLPRYLDDLNRA